MEKHSVLLYKTRCPQCAKKGNDKSADNLVSYSDGHQYCFSCGYFVGTNSIQRFKHTLLEPKKTELLLPEDVTHVIPEIPTKWLQKYDINPTSSTIMWSEEKQWLIFLIYDKDTLIAYQARNFFGSGPKWISYGISNNLFHLVGIPGSSIVLVEDLLSAFKVAKVLQTMPLFGSHIGLQRLARLKYLGVEDLYIWLDADKRSYALTSAKEAMSLGIKTKVIYTEKDPKEYSNDYITKILSKT
jgi:hypothetical protein